MTNTAGSLYLTHKACILVLALRTLTLLVPGFDNTVQLKFDRHALHAWKMRMLHPVTQEEITFTAAFPSDMKQFYPLS